jgi:hypothetical protein
VRTITVSREFLPERSVDPDACASATLLFRTVVLDGEIAIVDEQPRSRFDWLRGTPDAA